MSLELTALRVQNAQTKLPIQNRNYAKDEAGLGLPNYSDMHLILAGTLHLYDFSTYKDDHLSESRVFLFIFYFCMSYVCLVPRVII